ncbi:MAG: CCA tRNA nucleotidyltransferase, partial [Clostridia bacterium]|nr:CCA tRNA nucleotidyltransferase [Clostridia bacterium]
MKMNLPRAAQYAMRVLRNAGHQAYIVGGSVRDVLLGKQPDDYDITTSALPEEVIALFKRDKLVLNGLKHGTVRLIKYAMPIEITTFCLNGAGEDDDADDVIFTGSLYEDVQRRDITINALCWSEEAGLIDYVGGQEDLDNRLIRCVGEPNGRFREDPLRILRALRFSATLDFDIDPPTARAIRDNRLLLSELPAERVLMELKKLLCGPRAEALLVEYRDVFGVMLPETAALSGDQYLLAARRLSLIAPAPELRLAALLLDLPREAANECAARIKCSKLTRKFLDGVFEHANEDLPIDRVGMRRALGAYG